jgi:hypothetical protein
MNEHSFIYQTQSKPVKNKKCANNIRYTCRHFFVSTSHFFVRTSIDELIIEIEIEIEIAIAIAIDFLSCPQGGFFLHTKTPSPQTTTYRSHEVQAVPI